MEKRSRREFVKAGSLGGALVLSGGAPAAIAAAPSGPSAFELEEVTVDELQRRMGAGSLTARRLTRCTSIASTPSIAAARPSATSSR